MIWPVMGFSLILPISEEAAFRGYWQVKLEGKFSPSAAVVILSVLFALAHLRDISRGILLLLHL